MGGKKEAKEMTQVLESPGSKEPTSRDESVMRGFSKLSKEEKIDLILSKFLEQESDQKELLKSFWHKNEKLQKTLDEFSENTLSNFVLPFGVAPNIVINGENYCVPMVIEESSVVAAASKAAKFWMERGGFKAEILSTKKVGQVHLHFSGEPKELKKLFNQYKSHLFKVVAPLTSNMEERGGGLTSLSLKDLTHKEEGYFQLWAEFETCDAMGANFINSVLEALGKELNILVAKDLKMEREEDFEVIMAILSNYTPECLVKAWVDCPVEQLADKSLGMSPEHFAKKFSKSVRIAEMDVNRATTHNKGIMNGIDSVILATGNDFRAVEACAHTYAARSGEYKSLTHCRVENGHFHFEIEIPLSLGTVGGLTALHPLAKMSLELLGNPSAKELMAIVAVTGLAQNFAAVRSLTTTGIQKGHMKMHLMNILNHLETNEEEREKARIHFEDEVISFSAVSEFVKNLRSYQ